MYVMKINHDGTTVVQADEQDTISLDLNSGSYKIMNARGILNGVRKLLELADEGCRNKDEYITTARQMIDALDIDNIYEGV